MCHPSTPSALSAEQDPKAAPCIRARYIIRVVERYTAQDGPAALLQWPTSFLFLGPLRELCPEQLASRLIALNIDRILLGLQLIFLKQGSLQLL
jgi:hypothetical protein